MFTSIPYFMETLSKKWKSINFYYITIYIGLHNEEKLQAIKQDNNDKIKVLKESLLTARYMEQSKINKQIEDLEIENNLYNIRIVDKYGNRHSTTEEFITLQKNHWLMQKLFYFVYKSKKQDEAMPCSPVYCHAFVFCSANHEIKEIIYVCLSCISIVDSNNEHLEVNGEFYKKDLPSFLDEIYDLKQSKNGINTPSANSLYWRYYLLQKFYRLLNWFY